MPSHNSPLRFKWAPTSFCQFGCAFEHLLVGPMFEPTSAVIFSQIRYRPKRGKLDVWKYWSADVRTVS